MGLRIEEELCQDSQAVWFWGERRVRILGWLGWRRGEVEKCV
jgi:hypothetical protein